jgi:AcrR family transcriptional regulator
MPNREPDTPTPEHSPKRGRRTDPRVPASGRGFARFAALLDAADELLEAESPDVVGLYQIAKRADIPPASVYHFFPTKEAVFLALAERYYAEILQVHSVPIPARLLKSWQDLFWIDVKRAAQYYNRRHAAAKVLYGGYGGVEARNIDKIFVRKLAMGDYRRLNRIFHMPEMREPEKHFEVRLVILDSIWEISVRKTGEITPDYLEESVRACNAYMELYLPRHIAPRDLLVTASERDEMLHLHPPDPTAKEGAAAQSLDTFTPRNSGELGGAGRGRMAPSDRCDRD